MHWKWSTDLLMEINIPHSSDAIMRREINNALISCNQIKVATFATKIIDFFSTNVDKRKTHLINAKFIKLIKKIFLLK